MMFDFTNYMDYQDDTGTLLSFRSATRILLREGLENGKFLWRHNFIVS